MGRGKGGGDAGWESCCNARFLFHQNLERYIKRAVQTNWKSENYLPGLFIFANLNLRTSKGLR